MTKPIIAAVEAHGPALTLLGNPPRLYPKGDAPGVDEAGYALPYATWQTVSGVPLHNMDTVPTNDDWIVQIDVWGDTFDSTDQTAIALRDAIEQYPGGYINSWRGEQIDKDTRLYGYSFDAAFAVER